MEPSRNINSRLKPEVNASIGITSDECTGKTAAMAAIISEEKPTASIELKQSPSSKESDPTLNRIEELLQSKQMQKAEELLKEYIDSGKDSLNLHIWFVSICLKLKIDCLTISKKNCRDRNLAIHLHRGDAQCLDELCREMENGRMHPVIQHFVPLLYLHRPKATKDRKPQITNRIMEKSKAYRTFDKETETWILCEDFPKEHFPRDTFLQYNLLKILTPSLDKYYPIPPPLYLTKGDSIEKFAVAILNLVGKKQIREIDFPIDDFPKEVATPFKLALKPEYKNYKFILGKIAAFFFCTKVLKPTLTPLWTVDSDLFFARLSEIMAFDRIPIEILELAKDCCEWLVSNGDNKPLANYFAGLICCELKQEELSIKYFLEATKTKQFDIALKQLADYYQKSGKYEEAIRQYSKVSEKERDEIYYSYLNCCYIDVGNFSLAEKTLLKGLKAYPTSSTLWLHLSMLQNLKGQLELALESLRKAEEFNKPSFINKSVVNVQSTDAIAYRNGSILQNFCEIYYQLKDIKTADDFYQFLSERKNPLLEAANLEGHGNYDVAIEFIQIVQNNTQNSRFNFLKLEACKIRCLLALQDWEVFETAYKTFPEELQTKAMTLGALHSSIALQKTTDLKLRMQKLKEDAKKHPLCDFAKAILLFEEGKSALAINFMKKIADTPVGKTDLYQERLKEIENGISDLHKAKPSQAAPKLESSACLKNDSVDPYHKYLVERQKQEAERLKEDRYSSSKKETAPTFGLNDQIRLMKLGKFNELPSVSTVKRVKPPVSLAALAAAMPETEPQSSSSLRVEFVQNGPVTRPVSFDLNEETRGDLSSALRLLTYLEDTKNRKEITPGIRHNAMLFYAFRLCQTLGRLSPFKQLQSVRNLIRHSPDSISTEYLCSLVDTLSGLKETIDALLNGMKTVELIEILTLPETPSNDKSRLLGIIHSQLNLFDEYHSQLEGKPHKLQEEGDICASLQAAYLIIGKALRKLQQEHGMRFKNPFIHNLIKNGNDAAHNLGDRPMGMYADYEPLQAVQLNSLLKNKRLILEAVS